MQSDLVLEYIKQRREKLGAIGCTWEPKVVLVREFDPAVIDLEPNQRLYVPIFGISMNLSGPQNFSPADFSVTVESPTAKTVFTKGQFLPHGFDVLVMNGNEHSGKVKFSYQDEIGLPGDGIAVQVIVVDYDFPPAPPCPQPSTSC